MDVLTEREDKFDVEQSFRLPPLDGLVPQGGRIEQLSLDLNSQYFDTEDFALRSFGATLRRRTGTSDTGWHLKVPNGIARDELRFALDPDGETPAELLALTVGLRAGQQLHEVARLHTSRSAYRVLDESGDLLAEVADDVVTSSSSEQPGSVLTSQWREIEVELGSVGDENLLKTAGRRLTKAGARRSRWHSKLSRALESAADDSVRRTGAVGSPKKQPRKVSRSAGDVVLDYLNEQRRALLAGDLSFRRGEDEVHATRVATRRLRSTLMTFGHYFDPAQATALDGELAWFGQILGNVRDPEVQLARLTAAVQALPPELVLGPVSATITKELVGQHQRARQVLTETLDSDRYLRLLAEVNRWLVEPPLVGAATPAPALLDDTQKAVRRLERRLDAAVVPTDPDETVTTDAAFHRARKAAKRARYAAELSHPIRPKAKAQEEIKKHQRLQDLLGEHQDGVVAAELLRNLGAQAGGDGDQNGFTYGVLYAQELANAARSRQLATQWVVQRTR